MADSHAGPSLKRADVGAAAYLPVPIPADKVLIGDSPEVMRSIKYPVGEEALDSTLPPAAQRLGQVHGYNVVTGQLEMFDPANLLLAPGSVLNTMLEPVPAYSFKGNNTGVPGTPVDMSAAEATATLDTFVGDSGSGGTKGLVPAPIPGDTAAQKYLSADGQWHSIIPGVGVSATFRMAGA